MIWNTLVNVQGLRTYGEGLLQVSKLIVGVLALHVPVGDLVVRAVVELPCSFFDEA